MKDKEESVSRSAERPCP